MTQHAQTNSATHHRFVAVMTLPDGSELVMRETANGWSVIEQDARRSDLTLLGDIVAAYGFGPLRQDAPRPRLTLVSSR